MHHIASFVIPSVLTIGDRTPDQMLREMQDAGCCYSPCMERLIRRFPFITRQEVYPCEFRTNPDEVETVTQFRERKAQAQHPVLHDMPHETVVSLAIALTTVDKRTIRDRQLYIGSLPIFGSGLAKIFSVICTREDQIIVVHEDFWSTRPLMQDTSWFFGTNHPVFYD